MALFGCIRRARKDRDQLAGQCLADDTSAEHQHVHVVVLDALMRRVSVVTEASPDAAMLVRGNRGADAAATDEHSMLADIAGDRAGDRVRVIRVVDRLVAVRAYVVHLM